MTYLRWKKPFSPCGIYLFTHSLEGETMSVWDSFPLCYWPRSCVAPEGPGVKAVQKGQLGTATGTLSVVFPPSRACSEGCPCHLSSTGWPGMMVLPVPAPKQDIGARPCARNSSSTPKSIWIVPFALEIKLRIPLILEIYPVLLCDHTSFAREWGFWFFQITEAYPFKCLNLVPNFAVF